MIKLNKKIITGALYTFEELGADILEYMKHREDRFGTLALVEINPLDTKGIPEYIFGIVEDCLEGDGDEVAQLGDPIIKEVAFDTSNKEHISKIMMDNDFPEMPIKTYQIIYYS